MRPPAERPRSSTPTVTFPSRSFVECVCLFVPGHDDQQVQWTVSVSTHTKLSRMCWLAESHLTSGECLLLIGHPGLRTPNLHQHLTVFNKWKKRTCDRTTTTTSCCHQVSSIATQLPVYLESTDSFETSEIYCLLKDKKASWIIFFSVVRHLRTIRHVDQKISLRTHDSFNNNCYYRMLYNSFKNVRRTVKGKEMTKKLDYVPVVMISWEGREEC